MVIFKEQRGEPTQTRADRTRTRYAQVYISRLLCHSFCIAPHARESHLRFKPLPRGVGIGATEGRPRGPAAQSGDEPREGSG